MRKFIQVLFLVLSLVCIMCFSLGFARENATIQTTQLESENEIKYAKLSNEKMLESTLDGVVTVFSNGKEKSMGSGFCVKSGLIVTNQHVVNGGSEFLIATMEGDKSNVSLVYSNEALDVAILKTDKKIKVLKMGSVDKLKVGQEVYAIGTPVSFNFHHTVTKGIISGINRELELGAKDKDKKIVKNLIQHDASINPGNSGGVLINVKGEVIGINTLKVSSFEGMGFAIPIDAIKPIINEISKNV